MKTASIMTAGLLLSALAGAAYDSPILPAEQLPALRIGERVLDRSPRRTEKLPGTWKFAIQTATPESWPRPEFDDSGWKEIRVPLNWFQEYPGLCREGTPVRGCYRVKAALPERNPGDRLLLRIAQAGTELRFLADGREVGRHAGNFTPMEFDFTDSVSGGHALLAFEVNTTVREKPMRHAAGCSWGPRDEKGGIWGKVTLETRPAVYVAKSFVTPRPAAGTAEVECEIVNTTGTTAVRTLLAVVRSAMKRDRSRPADSAEERVTLAPGLNRISFSVRIANPVPWEPENPCLYYLQTALFDGVRLTDLATERFGMRTFEVAGREFRLNGNRIYLFGGNLLSVNYGGYGRDDRERLRRELIRLKSEGYNILRTPHQPIVEEAFELADELGMMIMNEWAWAFSRPLDETVFAENSAREVREWMRRDYNHPSHVMYSCGNEVFIRNAQHDYRRNLFNALVRQLRREDRSGRPVSVMDGCDDYYGTSGQETDLFSFHQYAGLSQQPWSMARETVLAQRRKSEARFGTRLDKPVILFECVGFSWNPPFRLFTREPLPVERYLKLAALSSTWGAPQAAAGIGATGMRLWLHPDFQLHHARNLLGKRILEAFRLMPDEIQGFSPWFMETPAENAVIWNAPLQSILADETLHPIAGKPFGGTLHLMNDQHLRVDGIELELTFFRRKGMPPHQARLIEPGDAEIVRRERLPQGTLAGFERRRIPLAIPTSPSLASGDYLLNIVTRGKRADGKRLEAVNFYEIFVQNPAELAGFATPATVGLPPGFTAGKALLEPILDRLGIPHREVKSVQELAKIGVLLIPPAAAAEKLPFTTAELLAFVRNGGRFACLEQNAAIPLPGDILPLLYDERPNALVDPVRPDHPVFAGLHPQLFDGWDGGEYRLVNRFAIPRFDESLLAAAGRRFEQNTLRSALLEYRCGKGSMLYSQLDAFRRFGGDSVATRYCRNLLGYLTARTPPEKDLPEFRPPEAPAAIEIPDAIPVPFGNAANRTAAGFPGKGENTLAALPTGRRTFHGIPFEIPASGNAIVAAGGPCPPTARPIPVGRKVSALAFLHGAAGAVPGRLGAYLVRYADGKSIEIPLVNGVEIGDWWNPADAQDAAIAWKNRQQTADGGGETLWTLGGEAGLYLHLWRNPREAAVIESVTLSAATGSPVFLAALSAVPERGATAFVPEARPKLHPDNGTRELLPGIVSRELLSGVPGYLCRMPKDGGYPRSLCFFYFPGAAPKQAECLAFLVRNRSETGISLRFVLPEKEWKDSLARTVYLEPGTLRRVEFNLTDRLKSDRLRGELMLSNSSPHPAEFEIGGFEFR